MKNMSKEQREKRYQNVGDPERQSRYIAIFENGVNSRYVFEGVANFEKLFKSMEIALADGRKWLLGDNYTLADISLTPFVARLSYLTLLDIWLESRPKVKNWWIRSQNKRSYEFAVDEALTKTQKLEMETFGSKVWFKINELRDEYLRSY